MHNTGLPSVSYYENGHIEQQLFFHYNNFHNNNGPALAEYNENGVLLEQKYYLYGQEYDILQYMVLVTCND